MTAEETTAAANDLQNKIVHQVEYYFGDINMPRDKFLQETLKSNEGWMPMDVLLKFNRLTKLTTDESAISEALRKFSKLIIVSDDGAKIQRNPDAPLPDNSLEFWQTVKTRTVYMKGFPLTSTLDRIEAFLSQFGDVDNVVMRRNKSEEKQREFKGSIFATFKTLKDAEAAVNSDAQFKASDSEDGVVLEKMLQNEYWAKKNQETKERKAAAQAMKQAQKVKEKVAKEAEKYAAHFIKGLVLKVSGLPGTATIAEIKSFLGKHGPVAYVVHDDGATTATVRFNGKENTAKEAWTKAEAAAEGGQVKYDAEHALTAELLEGDEEAAYWEAFNVSKRQKIENSKANQAARDGGGRGGGRGGRGGRGRGRGGRGGFNKRRGNPKRQGDGDDGGEGGGDENGAPPAAKQSKLEKENEAA